MSKKNLFINTQQFNLGAKELEKERLEKINTNISESQKTLTERTEDRGGEELKNEPTLVETPKKINEKQRKRIRFAVTLDEFVPGKYIKSGITITSKIHERILKEFKIMSIYNQISIEDLLNLAAYEFLVKRGQVKDQVLKEFKS